ncbi:MAG: hypothetical protein RML94_14945 [Bacteroidia bacterium]|nr:hypothetical protein [Bacteroidia bacterium]
MRWVYLLLREACGGCVSSAQHRSASVARSTPTLWAYAQRNAHKDTPKKEKNLSHSKNPKSKNETPF